ncbi:uncharacterized protein LOC129222811 [Uloborus diversus]|uniref:uncharacterized protein LOC129222811 n=1 Tax=Uloborus diversus TaxID=327109 RepID=UPI002409FFF6|nr:uncharacterized protein LOC129222811 [Uloborus diversus]
MKSFVVASFLVVALVGGVCCRRLPRQAEEAVPDVDAADVTTAAPNPKVEKLNNAMSFMLADLNNQAALGVPLDPKKVAAINKLAMIVTILGGEVNEPNQVMMSNLATPPPAYADKGAAASA